MDFFSVHHFVDAGHLNLRGGRQKFFLPFCYEWEPQHCSYCTVECSSSHHWNLRLLAMERSCTDFLSPWFGTPRERRQFRSRKCCCAAPYLFANFFVSDQASEIWVEVYFVACLRSLLVVFHWFPTMTTNFCHWINHELWRLVMPAW